jgi:thioredoxin 1
MSKQNYYAKYNSLGKTDELKHIVLEVKTSEHKKKVLRENHIVCINISGSWCNPCQMIAPRYAEMALKYARKGCLLVKEDYDLGLTENIQGVPTFLFFKGGHFQDSVTGADIDKVDDILRELTQEEGIKNPLDTNKPNPYSRR